MAEKQTQQRYVCRVCGYVNKRPFYDEMDHAEFDICPCCGCESGIEDSTKEGEQNYRKWWIQEGTKWFHPELKPENWNLEEQLRRIEVDLKDYQNN